MVGVEGKHGNWICVKAVCCGLRIVLQQHSSKLTMADLEAIDSVSRATDEQLNESEVENNETKLHEVE